MSMESLRPLQRSMENSASMLAQLDRRLGWDNPEKTYQALRAVLHALRDRLPVDEAVHLSAQLPLLVKGIYFEGWKPAHKPEMFQTADEFRAAVVAGYQQKPDLSVESVIASVLVTLRENISQGELEDVCDNLPAEIKKIFEPALARG